MRNVVIANCYPDDNRGSAALNDAACVIAAHAFPGAEIALISVSKTGGDRQSYRHSLAHHAAVRVLPPLLPYARSGSLAEAAHAANALRWLTRPPRLPATPTLSALRRADVVLSRGGYLLFDPGGVRWWIGSYLTLLPLLLAHRIRTPAATLPTSVIPPRTAFGTWALRRVLRIFDFLAVRDPWAQQTARQLGAPRPRLYADSVFILPAPSATEASRVLQRYELGGRRYAVLTTRTLRQPAIDRRKLQLQAAAIRDLLGSGAIDCALVGAQTVGPDLDESPSARELLSMVGERAVLLDGDFSHRDLMALYAGADVVLTQHLHSFIFSVMVGTPALVFSTDGAKVEGVVAGLGLPNWLVLDAKVDADDEFKSRLRRLRSARGEMHGQMLAAAAAARDTIETLIRDLASLDGI